MPIRSDSWVFGIPEVSGTCSICNETNVYQGDWSYLDLEGNRQSGLLCPRHVKLCNQCNVSDHLGAEVSIDGHTPTLCRNCIKDLKKCKICGDYTRSSYGVCGKPECMEKSGLKPCGACRKPATMFVDRIGSYLCENCMDNLPKAEKKECVVNSEFPIPIYTGAEIEAEWTDDHGVGRIKATAIKHGCDCGSDGSLNYGYEIKTPPLYGDKLEECLRNITKTMREYMNIDQKCGLHIHIDMADKTPVQVRQVAKVYALFEGFLFDMLPASRQANRYCVKLSRLRGLGGKKPDFNDLDQAVYGGNRVDYKIRHGHSSRYWALNIHSYFYRGTLEFRMHQGSLNYIKIRNWINILHNLVSFALSLNDEQINALGTSRKPKRWQVFNEKILVTDELREYYAQRVAKFQTDTNDNEVYEVATLTDTQLKGLL